jgi:hypothetical protein
VLPKTVHAPLLNDLSLSKKSAMWVTKLLDVKKKQARMCKAFVAINATVSYVGPVS